MKQGDSSQTMLSLLINTGYMSDKILPQLFVFYSWGDSAWIQPQVEFVVKTQYKIGIGANILVSDTKAEPYYGAHRDSSDIYTYVKYEF
jgi:hypothetical protein